MASFNSAFKAARNAGQKTFTYEGKRYHTRLKGESKEAWSEKQKSTQKKTFAAADKASTEKAPAPRRKPGGKIGDSSSGRKDNPGNKARKQPAASTGRKSNPTGAKAKTATQKRKASRPDGEGGRSNSNTGATKARKDRRDEKPVAKASTGRKNNPTGPKRSKNADAKVGKPSQGRKSNPTKKPAGGKVAIASDGRKNHPTGKREGVSSGKAKADTRKKSTNKPTGAATKRKSSRSNKSPGNGVKSAPERSYGAQVRKRRRAGENISSAGSNRDGISGAINSALKGLFGVGKSAPVRKRNKR